MDERGLPERIICLTEETVETLYLLNEEHRLAGVSVYAKRPKACQQLPKVSYFTSSRYEKIKELNPDLIIGFSDIQKDIARDLIEQGHNVMVTNQRTLEESLAHIQLLGNMVGKGSEALTLVHGYREKMELIRQRYANARKVPFYFEEWDEPMITGIRWVNELFSLFGINDIFEDKSTGNLAKERFVTSEEVLQANPELIFACWCGKKVKMDQLYGRGGWDQIEAIKRRQVFDLPPEIFLQPGPALFEAGLDYLDQLLWPILIGE
jgi:iron complex transport system substrate-binding protein